MQMYVINLLIILFFFCKFAIKKNVKRVFEKIKDLFNMIFQNNKDLLKRSKSFGKIKEGLKS